MKNLVSALLLGILLASGHAQAEPSQKATTRAKRLKADVKSFRLQLDYHGDEDKPFYRLTLSVPAVPDRSNSFHQSAQITEKQAKKIVDLLFADGFLGKADDLKVKRQRPPNTMPGYAMTVTTEEVGLRTCFEIA